MIHARVRTGALAGALLTMTVAASCSSSSPSNGSSTVAPTAAPATTVARLPTPAGATGAPPEVPANSTEWPLAGHDYDNTRRATGSTITAANVSRLAAAWRATPSNLGALSTAPIVLGDTVYLQGSSGVVVALARDTGAVRWTSAATGFNIGPFGVAFGDGRVYGNDGATGIVALDARTGKAIWHRRITATSTLGVDIQPTAFGGMVFASTVPVSTRGIYAGGDRGTVYALDARSGAIRWKFDTVKGDLWGNPKVNSGGGVWYTPAVDVHRRILYAGVANPAPFPGTAEYPNGSSRPGPNLYTDSVVALDLDRGTLLWYHQVTPHDLFDRDQVHVLLATVNGRDVVVSAGKSGVVLGLDPDTGRVLWQRSVGKHLHDDLTTLPGPTDVWPGTYGGVLTPPATADGTVYVATVNAPTKLAPDKEAYIGSELGTHDGEVVAIDVASGRVTWDTAVPGDPLGGATVVNDLVFTALTDGTVLALRRGDGHIVWRYRAGGQINGWLAAVGDSLFVPVTGSSGALLALRVGGTTTVTRP